MTGMREDLGRKLRHRQPRVDHPRREPGETHLPGCPVYAANVTACPAECNCWPWTDGNAEQPPPADLTLSVVSSPVPHAWVRWECPECAATSDVQVGRGDVTCWQCAAVSPVRTSW